MSFISDIPVFHAQTDFASYISFVVKDGFQSEVAYLFLCLFFNLTPL